MSNSKNHEKITPEANPGIYQMMRDLIRKDHERLAEARICLVWRYGWKRDKGGHLVLGKCKKASDYDKTFAEFDFVILLNAEAWQKLEWRQRVALLDHELCHATRSVNKAGESVWRIRKHDVEEFREIIERHGCYKQDLDEFVKAAVARERPGLFDAPTAEAAEAAGPQKEPEPRPVPKARSRKAEKAKAAPSAARKTAEPSWRKCPIGDLELGYLGTKLSGLYGIKTIGQLADALDDGRDVGLGTHQERVRALVDDAREDESGRSQPAPVRKCRVCGCTDNDCSQCIEKTGRPCTWAESDLCSACVEPRPIGRATGIMFPPESPPAPKPYAWSITVKGGAGGPRVIDQVAPSETQARRKVILKMKTNEVIDEDAPLRPITRESYERVHGRRRARL